MSTQSAGANTLSPQICSAYIQRIDFDTRDGAWAACNAHDPYLCHMVEKPQGSVGRWLGVSKVTRFTRAERWRGTEPSTIIIIATPSALARHRHGRSRLVLQTEEKGQALRK